MTPWTLHLGDCLDPVAGLASLPDKSVDHTITDPPFEAQAHTLQRRVKRQGHGKEEGYDDSRIAVIEALTFPPITEEQRAESAKQIARVTKRWALVFCQIEAAHKWAAALEAGGMNYRRTCIWVKPDGMPQYSGDRPGMGYEAIVAAHAKGRSTWNGGGRHGVFTVPKYDPIRTGHETQKPMLLMTQLVQLFTDEGETILDPFAGSGTTLLAALATGRKAIGWERDPAHHETARRRLSGEEVRPTPGQRSLFEAPP